MSNSKVYVGNLPYSMDNESMKTLFEEAGSVVSASVITDRETGRSKGFGFVEMSADDEATKAIESFDGREVDGRQLKVSIAKAREERPRTNTGNRW